jgi:hypothetical protein
MRIRSTKPEFWQDERLSRELSRDARLLYKALWSEADDHGRLRGNESYLHGTLFPYDPGEWFSVALEQIVQSGRAMRYSADGGSYLYLPKFVKNQKVDKPSESKLPPPPSLASDSREPRESLCDGSRATRPVAGSREQVAGSREGAREPPSTLSLATGVATVGKGSHVGDIGAYWLAAVRARRGSAVLRVEPADVKAAMVHLNGMPEADWKRCIDALVADDSKWVVDHGWSLRWIGQKIAAYSAPPVDSDPLKYFTGHENDPPDAPPICACGRRHGIGQECPGAPQAARRTRA